MTSDNLLSGVIGGIFGGLCSVAAVLVQNCLNRRSQAESEKKLVKSVLQAIRAEVETLWGRYYETVGKRLAELRFDQPFLGYWLVSQDYFTVYTTNASLLGRVENQELRLLIVQTYTLARATVDSFRINNEMNQKYEDARLRFEQTKLSVYQDIAVAFHKQRVDYAETLRDSHTRLKDHVERLLRTIDEG